MKEKDFFQLILLSLPEKITKKANFFDLLNSGKIPWGFYENNEVAGLIIA